ncbi:MAG: N-acetyltransferase, GCN5-related protein [Frankiales bacterium]|nr:N-acetyltransferase, GCN5-related protein [Frankiales bacterium]
MSVTEVDPTDDDAFDAWFGVVDACHRYRSPHEPGWQRQELQAVARASRQADAPVLTVTLLAGSLVADAEGAARLDLPLRESPRRAELAFLEVHPDARRGGTGRALLQEAGRAARLHGRDELLGRVEQRAGEDAPGHAFAASQGAVVVQTDVRRDLAVPVDPARLDALEERCLPHASGYVVRTWTDACPEELLEDRALLARRMSTDAPNGDLAVEEQEWDAARVRFGEQLLREQGRARLAAGAVHTASGRLVAFTEVALPRDAPVRAYQWDTLVLREHRGRRLGTLVKLAVLRGLPAAWPDTRTVSTWNADDNAPMIAVNEALGCVVAGTSTTYRLALP